MILAQQKNILETGVAVLGSLAASDSVIDSVNLGGLNYGAGYGTVAKFGGDSGANLGVNSEANSDANLAMFSAISGNKTRLN